MHNIIIGASKYDWTCTDADDESRRYIPCITRDLDDVKHVPTNGDELHIYHLSELDESCYGRVIAIKYCYQFNDTTVPAAFNWTVLILEDRLSDHNNFEVIDTITIESCESDTTSCRSGQPWPPCCDMINIENIDLVIEQKFTFGVIKSAQGNTAGATLLGFADALPQYQVDVVLINRVGLTLSVGSTIRNRSPAQRGIRMLWFVIGKLTFTTSKQSNNPMYPLLADDEKSTVSTRASGTRSSSSRSSRSVTQETTCVPTQDTESSDQTSTQLTNEDESHSATVISASIGGAIGGILGLSLVSIIIVLLVIVRRHQLEKAPGHIENDVKGYHNAVYNGMFIV